MEIRLAGYNEQPDASSMQKRLKFPSKNNA
jgi:hypothetical protein